MTPILPRTTPAAVGLSPAAVRLLIDNLGKLDAIHTLIVVRGGHVVAEAAWAPHSLDRPHMMFSVSKSVTSMAVGLAIDEGRFGLDDRVVDLLPDDAPADPSPNLAAMTVRHLLTMASGHAADTFDAVRGAPGGWARRLLALPVEHAPGTWPVYNTGATYLLGAIVQRLTGQRLLDYLRPRLFEPLGITTATWEQDPDGLDVAGSGLAITTEELAAFGQLCLQRGRWRGRQLVPAAWVDAATATQVASPVVVGADPTVARPDSEQGYGFQFWRCRHGAYRADGAFGQYAIVWPEHDMVIAINAGTANMQGVLDAVWTSLLPALSDRTASVAGDSDETIDTSGCRLSPPAGAPASPREASILGVTHALDTPVSGITHVTLVRDEQGRLGLRTRASGQERTVVFGYDEWVPGVLSLGWQSVDVASAAAWVDESRLVARTVTLGSPYTRTLALELVDGGLEVTLDLSVSFGPTHLGHATA
ncbi:MAG: serine hydrolase, partial [Micromonosporaceae bacterium]|nr:serine hydrolase [Micromonosporaceae bacterium]